MAGWLSQPERPSRDVEIPDSKRQTVGGSGNGDPEIDSNICISVMGIHIWKFIYAYQYMDTYLCIR